MKNLLNILLLIQPNAYLAFNFLLVLVAIILFANLYFLYWRNKRQNKESRYKQQIENIQNEHKFLNALMNPHFIFNTMNSISFLVSKKETEAAEKYIAIMSRLIRQNMENISSPQIPLIRELELVENYFELEKLRFKSRISLHINVTEDDLNHKIMIPPLSIQPLVENAIIHGFDYGKKNGAILILAERENNKLVVTIIDNGEGMKKIKKGSIALKTLQKRLEGLNILSKNKFNYTIENHYEENNIAGCKAQFVIST